MERKLASVRRISRIEPIPEADLIVKASVDGWTLITAKNNNFHPGDLVVYFEIDSFLPVEDRYEFLRKSSFKSTQNLGDGFRIKTMKMKGVLSQGLIIPLEKGYNEETNSPCHFIIDKNGNKVEVSEGDDLTELLGVQKYEKPIPAILQGKVKGNFPLLIKKTDQERIQNLIKELTHCLDDEWEVSLKLDGSSMTVYHKAGNIGVCSRNLDLLETEDNLYWIVARKLKIPEMIKWTGRNLAFQGELMGPGVQGNREWLKYHTFFLYDVWDIDNQKYLPPSERQSLVENINSSGFELPSCHVFGFKKLKEFGVDTDNILTNVLQFAEGPSMYNPIREGIVFKHKNGQMSFKAISNHYLLQEKG